MLYHEGCLGAGCLIATGVPPSPLYICRPIIDIGIFYLITVIQYI